MPTLDCVDKNLAEAECHDSDDEIYCNQDSDHKSSISDSNKSDGKAVL